jgi:transcriptional regulator with XRE-family HTH domain
MKRRHRVTTEVGARVRKRRSRLGLSQEQLAFRAGLHPTYISGIERGERNVSLINLVRVAGALEVDPGQLVRGLK